MNLNHLAIFKAVAEEGGVSRGAERLMISQPAVSKQLRLLEKALGVGLFDRRPGGVRLTAAGDLLLGYAKRLFAIEAEAEQSISQYRGVARGRLSLGASMTIGVYLLPALVAAFRRQHPDMDIRWELGNTHQVQEMLLTGSLDLGLTEGSIESSEFLVDVFRHDELVPVAGRNHPMMAEKSVTLEAFLRERLIFREVGSGTREVVERALGERGFPAVRPALSVASTEAIKRAVAEGLGVAFVSDLAVVTELAAGTLARVPISGFSIRRPLHRLELRGKTRTPAVDAFIELLGATGEAPITRS